MHAAGKHTTDQNPQKTGHIAELCGKHRSKQRTRRSNSGEMVTEKDVLVGGDVVLTVRVAYSRSLTGFIDIENFLGDEQTVETVSYRKDAESGENDGYSVNAGLGIHRNLR